MNKNEQFSIGIKRSLFNYKLVSLRKEKNLTQMETSEEIGITRERIRQIEAKALRKLRHSTRRHYFQ